MEFKLSHDNAIHGGQLEAAIFEATGQRVEVLFNPPRTVVISDEWRAHEREIARLVKAHRPDYAAPALAALRRERDRRLAESDWTQLPDAPLSGGQKEAWRVYRQVLRDLPEIIKVGKREVIGEVAWPPRPD